MGGGREAPAAEPPARPKALRAPEAVSPDIATLRSTEQAAAAKLQETLEMLQHAHAEYDTVHNNLTSTKSAKEGVSKKLTEVRASAEEALRNHSVAEIALMRADIPAEVISFAREHSTNPKTFNDARDWAKNNGLSVHEAYHRGDAWRTDIPESTTGLRHAFIVQKGDRAWLVTDDVAKFATNHLRDPHYPTREEPPSVIELDLPPEGKLEDNMFNLSRDGIFLR